MNESIRFAKALSPRGDQLFLGELDPPPFPGELLNKGPEVIEVPGEPAHAVDHQSIPVAEEAQQLLELGPFRVLARGLVR